MQSTKPTNEGTKEQIRNMLDRAYREARNPNPIKEKRKQIMDKRKKARARIEKELGL